MATHAKKDDTAAEDKPAAKAPAKAKTPATLGESASEWAARMAGLAEDITNSLGDAYEGHDKAMQSSQANGEHDIPVLMHRVRSTLADIDRDVALLRATVTDLQARVG